LGLDFVKKNTPTTFHQSTPINCKRMSAEQGISETVCDACQRKFKSRTGLKLHKRKCDKKSGEDMALTSKITAEKRTTQNPTEPDPPPPKPPDEFPAYKWGNYTSFSFEENFKKIYESIVFWRRNLFLLPTGNAGKWYIDETVRLINEWLSNSPLKNIAFKAIMIMPSLLLQKPSKESKSRDHLEALERRRLLWEKGDLMNLFEESKTIQNNFPSLQKPRSIAEITKKFVKEMRKGNVNGAIKLLSNNMQNGIVPLTQETINSLKIKHPENKPASEDILLPDEPETIHLTHA